MTPRTLAVVMPMSGRTAAFRAWLRELLADDAASLESHGQPHATLQPAMEDRRDTRADEGSIWSQG